MIMPCNCCDRLYPRNEDCLGMSASLQGVCRLWGADISMLEATDACARLIDLQRLCIH
jgi:hypothetical protein